jgi:transcriptional regulator with XRE-family HTH domain
MEMEALMPQQKSRGEIGPAIARWRKSIDMTQQDLAHDLGVSVSFIGQMEIGKKNPSMEMVVQIVMLLNRRRAEMNIEPVDMNEAFTMAGYPPIAAPQRFDEIVQVINKLTTTEIRTAISILKALGNEENEAAT